MNKNKAKINTTAPLLVAPLILWMASCGGDSTPSYEVTASSGIGGSVSPAQMTVQEGDSANLRVTAFTGYEIKQVSGCGGALDGRDYVINEVTQNCQVTASFEERTFELNAKIHFSAQPDNDYRLPTVTPESKTVKYNDRKSFTLSLPDQNWSFRDTDGCPVDDFQFENSRETQITITTGPILAPCTLNLYVDVPDPNLEFEVSTNVINGQAHIEGASGDTATFRYGEQVRIEFTPFGERELISLDGLYSECIYSRDGNSVRFTATSECYFSAEFLGDNEQYFADGTLLQAFRSKLQLEPEELLRAEMVASVEEIMLPHDSLHIYSLEGIEAASKLRSLSFKSRTVNFAPLAELSLEALHVELNNYGAVNLEYLVNLPLQELSLTYLNVEPAEYQVLSQLDTLEYLNLNFNRQLQRIDFVEELPQLRNLHINQTGVLDIRPVLQSGLVYAKHNSFIQVGGCASMEQPVTRSVINQLLEKGVSTSVSSNSNWGLCPSSMGYYEGSVSASLENNALSLSWDSNAEGDVACTLFFNLHAQQPRVSDATIEQCGTSGSVTLNVGLEIQQLDLYIDDGLFPNPAKVASAQVESRNDVSELRLAAVDWGQSTFKSNPYLVPGRSALFRAHLIADGTPEAPQLLARLHLNGNSKDVNLETAARIPSVPVYDALDSSYRLEIPAEWMHTGLEVEVMMGGETLYTSIPSFAEPTTIYITIVPMVVDDVAPVIPPDEELKETIKTYWPVGEVVLERRDPFIVEQPGDGIGAHQLLYMLADLHAQEGAQHYYHGFFNLDTLGNRAAAGVAFRPGVVGVSYDRAFATHETFAHELGHNFSIGHIDCGGPSSVEVHYPYAPEFIGSVGISYDFSTSYGSEEAADVMSYCRPRFISDWVYEKAQDYLADNPPKSFTAVQALDTTSLSQPVFSTYISGIIDQLKGNSELLSHFELNQPAGRESDGPFVMIATDSQGRHTERRFAIDQTSESTSETNGYFSVRVPAFDIREVRIFHQGREILQAEL